MKALKHLDGWHNPVAPTLSLFERTTAGVSCRRVSRRGLAAAPFRANASASTTPPFPTIALPAAAAAPVAAASDSDTDIGGDTDGAGKLRHAAAVSLGGVAVAGV